MMTEALMGNLDNCSVSVDCCKSKESVQSLPMSPSIKIALQPVAMAQPLAPPCGHVVVDDEDEDDEESVRSSSTTNQYQYHPAINNNRRRRRTIQFPPNQQISIFHNGADIDELAENRRALWYQYEELKNIKRKALSVAKEAQRYGLGAVLTNTYGKRCEETQEALNTWARNGSSRRGLERWINDEYAAKRSDIRKRTIQSVVRAQAKMKESSLDDPDYSFKVLSRLSEAFSIDSRQFARGMGSADAIAASVVFEEGEGVEGSESDSPARSYLVEEATLSSTEDLRKSMRGKGNSSLALSFNKSSRAGKRVMGNRNLGLTAPSVSADFRHYY